MKEKDVLLASTRAKLESLQADHCASDDTVTGLEQLLADKDKQIERSETLYLSITNLIVFFVVLLNSFVLRYVNCSFEPF